MRDLVKISKTISYALRHDPGKYGLVLDSEGYVNTLDLVRALNITIDDILAIMAKSDKQRYEFKDQDVMKIRAFYGHSTVEIDRSVSEPPEHLYHGTAQLALSSINTNGLKPMSRKNVHYSTEIETAINVARRHSGEVAIIKIESLRAFKDGIKFYFGNEDIWMSDYLPVEYIKSILITE